MKLSGMLSIEFKKSIYTKVLLSILAALLIIIFLMEISNFYVLNQYRQRAEEMYQNSLELYTGFWADKLKTINTSMISIMSYERGMEYSNLCESEDALLVEMSKIQMQEKLIDIAQQHGNQVCIFTYIPERNIFVRSAGPSGDYAQNLKNEESVKKYIEKQKIENGNEWKLIKSGSKYYFLHIYHMFNGYVGAYIECDIILEDLLNGNKAAEAVAIMNKNDEVIVHKGKDIDYRSAMVFRKNLDQTEISFGVIVSQTELYSERDYLVLLSACAIIIGCIIITVVIQFQRKVVFNPLNCLKDAMEAFSRGQTEVRLIEYPRNNEIKVLYETFNHMAEQIMKLKINIYENMIERQKIQSSFLRVQIQPHFYTNILNLIYGLSEIKDFQSIQTLTVHLSQYFRYLLSNKDDFVSLEQELLCIRNYVSIQKMRYPDCISLRIDNSVDEKQQLIPPLLLQTFIENSIKHNITMVPLLEVVISIHYSNHELCILIEDNGLGFQKDILEKIMAGEDIMDGGRHIGIMNVKERIGLLYEGKAEIHIVNKTIGAAIYINVPERIGITDGK